MKLNRNELRKIMYDFNSLSNRLLQADFRDYDGVLERFVRFIADTEIINDYVSDCGICQQNLAEEYTQVQSGNAVFDLGDTDEEEVCNVYAILKYSVENNITICYGVGMSYSNSRSFQDILKTFNDRVTMVLIRHIESYLTKVGIDMGVDEKRVYNISVKDGQVNIANDNSSINATNSVSQIDSDRLEELLQKVIEECEKSELTDEEKQTVENSIEVIRDESKSTKPRKAFLGTAVTGIKAIKGTAEFGAAAVALYQFIQPFI